MYAEELLEAERRTLRLGLSCPDVRRIGDRLITSEKHQGLFAAVKAALGPLAVEEVIAQCLSLHLRLKSPLEEFFHAPLLYTIGYLEIPGDVRDPEDPPQYMFKKSESELWELMQSGMTGSQVSLHAWLTLPSMEIIDVSFPASFALLNGLDPGWPPGHLGAITNHPDKLDGLKYHPMLLGEDYLRKIGALVD